ncbi:hypothetical protein GQF63_06805 [Sphingobacterium humi]|uniref:DUF4870 domain-containing protein n=2 Tax=Sphingobacterium humi TaxID=1796905 RepID=A0A6N8L1R7_9SPHI|nr:hypothetical protein [Sphingobacterium humi]
MENPPQNSINDGKNIAIIAYLTIIGLIIAFVLNNEKKNDFASFHIRQSLGIMLMMFAVSIVSYLPYIGGIIAIAGFIFGVILWIMGIMNAVNGNKKPVPVVGERFSELFAGI